MRSLPKRNSGSQVTLKWKLTTVAFILLIAILDATLITLSSLLSLEMSKLAAEFVSWSIVLVALSTAVGYLIRKYY